tara:strand:- start:296 stop:535 length:240 start_codon:yes stop_codon:yes gene_type:complete
MLTKEQAIYNLSKAYLHSAVSTILYFDSVDPDAANQYHTARANYDAMQRAYLDLDVLTYTELRAITYERYDVIRKPSDQ